MRFFIVLIGLISFDDSQLFSQCPSSVDQWLIACTVSDPNNDDECLRMTFPYYFEYVGQQQPAPTSFEVKQANIRFTISGDGYFDIDKCISNYQYGNFTLTSPKEIIWFTSCEDTPPGHNLPYGDCQNLLLSLAVVGEPGAQITVTPESSLWYMNSIAGCDWEDRCVINSFVTTETKQVAQDCSTDYSVRLDSIPTGDPGDEVQLFLVIENNSATELTLNEVDFKIKITDEYGTLGGIYLDPNTNNNDPPAIEFQSDDDYYYLLNSFMGGNTIPAGGELTILAFSINEPDGLENLLGESNITVEYARMNIAGGSCCLLDVSSAKGTVTFPGELPCTTNDVTFLIRQINPLQLSDCQTGVEIFATTATGAPVTIKNLLFELLTETSGNLQIGTTNTPPGFSSNYSCGIIPCQQGGNYPICYGCTTQFEYNGTGITLNSGDAFQIIFDGLNGQLDVVELLQAAIYVEGSSGLCIPKIDIDPALSASLPISNGCNFCNNISLVVDDFQGTNEPLELCEQGFSLKLDISGNAVSLDEMVIEFKVMADGPINLEAFPLSLCNFNGSNNCLPPGQTECVSVNNNIITYRICSTNSIGGQFNILDVKFSHSGAGQNESCVNGIFFTENTNINIELQGSCVPYYDMSNDPFPLCSSCDPDVNTISGSIYKENGDPVLIAINANFDLHDSCATNPIEGITIRAGQESGSSGCICTPQGCPEELTGTSINPCGFYSQVFNCGQNTYSIAPHKNVNAINGVTTFDLVLINKHILAIQPLDSPYKIIAADAANFPGPPVISNYDLIFFKQLILNIIQEIPGRTSWRFIPASYVFPDPANPWAEDFPECIAVDMTNQTEAQDQDFIAIKVGDVNLSATTGCGNAPPLAGAAAGRAADAVQLQGVAGPVAEGEKAEVQVWVESPADLVAWQAGLWFDTGYLELESVAAGALDYMTPANFGTTEKEAGKLRVLWYAQDARPLPYSRPREAFKLHFRIKRAFDDWSAVLRLNDDVLGNAAWEDDGRIHALSMSFRSEPIATEQAAQVEPQATAIPNPFSEKLTVSVTLPADEWIRVDIFDATGRHVDNWQGETTNRKAAAIFDTAGWGRGVYTYRVFTAYKVLSGTVQRQ